MPRSAHSTGVEPTDGRLRPCPASPNCVSSHDQDRRRAVAPLRYGGDPEAAMMRLETIIAAMPRARIETSSPTYLHARFQTPILRFCDDLELLLDREAEIVHVRSASRLGYSDFGVNRKRVEAIRRAFATDRGEPAS